MLVIPARRTATAQRHRDGNADSGPNAGAVTAPAGKKPVDLPRHQRAVARVWPCQRAKVPNAA